MVAQTILWSLLVATLVNLVIVMGEQDWTTRNPPNITVSTETPRKGDVFKLSCSYDVDQEGSNMVLTNDLVKCAEDHCLYGEVWWNPNEGEHDPPLIINGTAGEIMTGRVSATKLELNVEVTLTCNNMIDYECGCEDIGVGDRSLLKATKKLDIDGC